jgi:hypothetical protein
MRHLRWLVLLLPLLASDSARAADDEEVSERKVVYRQKTEIDFEGLDVEASLVKPQGALVLDRKKASFNPLIKLRTDFNTEIDQSTDEIK